MKMTIRWKLGLSLLGTILAASLLGGYVHFREMVDGEEESLITFAGTVGPLVEESLTHSMLARDPGVLRKTLSNLVALPSIDRIMLVNNDGVVKAGTDPEDVGKKLIIREVATSDVRRAALSGNNDTFRWTQSVSNRSECHGCHDPKFALNGSILVDFSTGDLKKQALHHMTMESTIVVGAILFIGVFMFFLFDKMVIVRLGVLREGMRSFKEGAVETRVPAHGNDEVADLCAGFNEMATSIVAAQDDLHQYAHELLALAVSSNVVTGVPRTENIFEAACSLAVKELGINMAWCGVLRQGCHDIEPIAHCGFDEYSLSNMKITWDDAPSGMGPTGMAVKTKGPYIMNDISADPAYAPWRDEALKRGNRSSMALPLLTSDADVLGVMNLYSDEPNYFTRKRVRIFVVFANQVASAIENRFLIENVEKTSSQIIEQFKALDRSQKEWQTTFDSITDLVSIHDREFRIIKANKAFFAHFGLAPQEVLNKKCHDVVHGTCLPVTNCPHKISMNEKRVVTEEVRDPKTNKLLRVSTFPYYSQEGEFVGSVHIARDITDEKETEMRLIMSQRLAALGQMASGVAHEINTPLASIAGCAEGLLMKVKNNRYDSDLFEEYLQIVTEEVLRCKSITTGMLSIVRTDTYEKKDVLINDALDKALEIISFQGRLRDIEIMRKYQSDLPVIYASEGELRQVFLIIITNALDAMENRGKLTLETQEKGASVSIRISDSGPGIAPENLNRIFDPFFSTKSSTGGTGLGLSIAFKIMSNHSGTIEAQSEEGKGTTFTLTLPLPE